MHLLDDLIPSMSPTCYQETPSKKFGALNSWPLFHQVLFCIEQLISITCIHFHALKEL